MTALVGLAFYLTGFAAWRLGKRHGYITPPELIGDRLTSRVLRVVVVTVMVVFTLPYLASQPMETWTLGFLPLIPIIVAWPLVIVLGSQCRAVARSWAAHRQATPAGRQPTP